MQEINNNAAASRDRDGNLRATGKQENKKSASTTTVVARIK